MILVYDRGAPTAYFIVLLLLVLHKDIVKLTKIAIVCEVQKVFARINFQYIVRDLSNLGLYLSN